MDSTLLSANAGTSRTSAATRRTVLAGVLLAGACVLGLLEAGVASPVPGVRLGLANIAVLVALVSLGEGPALAVSILRVGIVGLATGTLFGPTSALAVAGAFVAWAAMAIALRSPARFSLVGISIAGSAAHVSAQFAVAAILVGTPGILGLASFSLLASLLFGIATGLVARLVISRLEGSVLTGR